MGKFWAEGRGGRGQISPPPRAPSPVLPDCGRCFDVRLSAVVQRYGNLHCFKCNFLLVLLSVFVFFWETSVGRHEAPFRVWSWERLYRVLDILASVDGRGPFRGSCRICYAERSVHKQKSAQNVRRVEWCSVVWCVAVLYIYYCCSPKLSVRAHTHTSHVGKALCSQLLSY